jgi:hypothetical protein
LITHIADPSWYYITDVEAGNYSKPVLEQIVKYLDMERQQFRFQMEMWDREKRSLREENHQLKAKIAELEKGKGSSR